MPARAFFFTPDIRRATLAGAGFALAFGWVWFEPLRELCLGDALSGSLFSGGGTTAFATALALVFLAAALGAGGLLPLREKRQGIAAHLAALLPALCLFLPRSDAWANLTTGAALGLAGGIGGTYWLAAILRLPPRLAALAVASAGLAAAVLSAALSSVSGLPSIGLYALRAAPAVCLLLALVIALRLEASAERGTALSPSAEGSEYEAVGSLVWIFVSAAAFFALGVLTGAWDGVPPGASEDAANSGTTLWPRCLLEALGSLLALSVFLMAEKRRFPPLFLGLAFALPLAASAALFPAFFKWPWLSGLCPPLLNGFLQGLAATLLALRLWLGSGKSARALSMAAWALLAVFVLVNAGFFTGARAGLWGSREYAGLVWLMLFCLACLLLPALSLRRRLRMETKRAMEKAALAPEQTGLSEDELQNLLTDWNLTPKEKNIAVLLRSGLSNPEIAAGAGISENTLRVHLKNLYRKSGAPDRNGLKLLLTVRPGAAAPENGTGREA